MGSINAAAISKLVSKIGLVLAENRDSLSATDREVLEEAIKLLKGLLSENNVCIGNELLSTITKVIGKIIKVLAESELLDSLQNYL